MPPASGSRAACRPTSRCSRRSSLNAKEFVELGGLIAYGASVPDLNRRAAIYVGKILRGANAGELPIEQPTQFELAINLKTARSLGLAIPPSLLARPDQ